MNGQTKKTNILTLIIVAVAACLIYGISSGIRSNYGIMINAISENSGVAYSAVSFVLAIAQLAFGIMQPIFGIIAMKRSNAFVLSMGAILIAVGLIGVPFSHSIWTLILFLGGLIPAGAGALSFGIIMGAITPVMGESKAAAVSGFVSASSGLGSTVLAPMMQWLLSQSGLRIMMIVLCVPTLCLIPVSLWLSRCNTETEANENSETDISIIKIFTDALHNKYYLFLIIGFFTCGFHMAIIETHLFSQFVSYGVVEEKVAFAFSIYGITTMLGSVISGILDSRFKIKNVLGGIYTLRVFVILLLLVLPKTVMSVYITAALLGFTGASTVPPTSGIVGKIFGTKKMATLFGIVFVSHQIGSFFSSWLGGVCVQVTNGYTLIWIVSILLSIVAAIVSFSIKETQG